MHAAKDPAAGGAVGGGGGARVWAEAQGMRTLVAFRLRAAAAAAQKQEHRPDDQHAHPQSQRRTAARRRVTREEEGDTVAAWRVASAAHIAQPAERERHAWLLRPPSPRRVGCRCRCCRCCHRAPASAAGAPPRSGTDARSRWSRRTARESPAVPPGALSRALSANNLCREEAYGTIAEVTAERFDANAAATPRQSSCRC